MNKHHQSEIKALKFDEETLRSDEVKVKHVNEEALKATERRCALKSD